jgi:hypothetical protein
MWVAHVNVDDVKSATAKAKSLGAKVERRARGQGRRVVQHHHRPDKSDAQSLAAEERLTTVTQDRMPISIGRDGGRPGPDCARHGSPKGMGDDNAE